MVQAKNDPTEEIAPISVSKYAQVPCLSVRGGGRNHDTNGMNTFALNMYGYKHTEIEGAGEENTFVSPRRNHERKGRPEKKKKKQGRERGKRKEKSRSYPIHVSKRANCHYTNHSTHASSHERVEEPPISNTPKQRNTISSPLSIGSLSSTTRTRTRGRAQTCCKS